MGNRGNWCYPFENQDTLGTECIVIDFRVRYNAADYANAINEVV